MESEIVRTSSDESKESETESAQTKESASEEETETVSETESIEMPEEEALEFEEDESALEYELIAAAPESDFRYDYNGVLVGYTGNAAVIEIPAGVVTIGTNFLAGNGIVTKVTIPESVKTIGNGAFSGCAKLNEVVLNAGLETIGAGAFANSALGDVNRRKYGTLTIPGSVTQIGRGAFGNCAGLGEVIFADGGTEPIDIMTSEYLNQTFAKCPELKRVTLPNRLRTLPDYAFSNCPKLSEVSFGTPEGSQLTTIGRSVFSGCALVALDFPVSLRIIGAYAFSKCGSLMTVNLNDGLETIGEFAFAGAAFGDGNKQIYGKLTIPGSVTQIGGGAFSDSAYIGEVEFESGTAILNIVSNNKTSDGRDYNKTFAKCPELKKVTLPDRLTELQDYIFSDCPKLTEVNFGTPEESKLAAIGKGTFSNCGIKEVKFPLSLRTIGEKAFAGCNKLITVELNGGLETIGAGSFAGAAFGDESKRIYSKLTIPGSVTEIGEGAFSGSTCLGEVVFENNGDGCLNILSNKYDGKSTFANCPKLKKVTLPDQMWELPMYAFYNCPELTDVIFGANLDTLGEYVFSYCGIQKVEFPSTLLEIGEHAFSHCDRLMTVKLNDGLDKIGAWAFAGSAFGDESSQIYGKLTIPGSVTEIGKGAFNGSACLGEVEFETGTNNILSIQSEDSNYYGEKINRTFSNCPKLKKVTLPERLKILPEYIFSECPDLAEVIFGAKLETIGKYAFLLCGLQGVEFPLSLRTIGEGAFSFCSPLTEVKFNEGLATIESWAFQYSDFGDKGAGIYGTLTIPGSVTKIGFGSFQNSDCLEEIIFENGTETSLDMYGYNWAYNGGTFYACSELKKVILPNRLQELSPASFSYCPKLRGIYIPKNVKTIYETVLAKSGNQTAAKITIYGDKGTVAERFANYKGFPFKEGMPDFVLGDPVASVSLNYSNITKAVTEDALPNTAIKLTATVNPATVRNKNKKVTFTSSDETIATVAEDGTVTLAGFGIATITATSAVDSSKKTECKLTVLRQWTESEQEKLRTELEALLEETPTYTNLYDTVKKISWKNLYQDKNKFTTQGIAVDWLLPESRISEGADEYDVVVKKEGYQDIALKVSITGIAVESISIKGQPDENDVYSDAPAKLRHGKTANLYVVPVVSGTEDGKLTEGYEVTWSSVANSGVTIATKDATVQDKATVTGDLPQNVSKKDATIKAIIRLKDKSGNLIAGKGTKNKDLFEASTKIAVYKDPMAARIVVTVNEIDASDAAKSKIVPLESLAQFESLADPKAIREYILSATVYDEDDINMENALVQWKSSNTNTANIVTRKSADKKITYYVLQVKGKGSAVVSVSAYKNGGYTKSFRVTVKDSTPRLTETDITLNLYQEEPIGIVHIFPSDDYTVNDTELNIVNSDKNKTASAFTLEKKTGAADMEYMVKIAERDGLKTGKRKYLLRVTTGNDDKSNKTVHELPLNINVVKQKPKVTLTQAAALNLYEKDGTATIKISADAEIESIAYACNVPNNSTNLQIKQIKTAIDTTAKDSGTFTVELENTAKATYAEASGALAKGTVTVKFNGYTDDANYTNKTFAIRVNKTLPAITAAPENATLYPEKADLAMTTILFKMKAGGAELKSAEGWRFVSPDNTAENKKILGAIPVGVTFGGDDSEPKTVTLGTAAKSSSTLKFQVNHTNWRTGMKLPVLSCVVKKGATPEIAFSNSNVILNKNYASYGKDVTTRPVKVIMSVKGYSNDSVTYTSIEGKDDLSKNALYRNILSIAPEQGHPSILLVGLTDNSSIKRDTKYTYIVKGRDRKGITVEGKLNVTVSTKAASVTYSQSGSIEALDRENSKIVCIPYIKNYTDKVTNAKLSGIGAGNFKVLSPAENGAITIQANKNASLKAKYTYTLELRIVTESGVVLSNNIKITPKQTNPKLKVNPGKIVLFESVSKKEYGQEMGVESAGAEIKGISLVDGWDTFAYDNDPVDKWKGKLYVKKADKLSKKSNATYVLKLAVTFEDSADNAAPAYVTVPVLYKK